MYQYLEFPPQSVSLVDFPIKENSLRIDLRPNAHEVIFFNEMLKNSFKEK